MYARGMSSSFSYTASVLLLLMLLGASRAYGQPQVDAVDDHLASQRYHYQKAKKALGKKDSRAYAEHVEQLGGYPLLQYLEFAQIRGRLDLLPFSEIDAFLERYPDTFLESRLRYNLLDTLAKRKKWQEYLSYYQVGLPSLTLRCFALEARLRTGDESALDEVEELWNVGKSQISACDGAFIAWQKAGRQTEELVWSRFSKAMDEGEMRFARYLAGQMKERAALADLYLKVHSRPALIKQRGLFNSQSIEIQQIIAHGVQQLAKKEPLDALYHWELYEAQQLFPLDVLLSTKLEVVKRLIRKGHTDEAQQLLSVSHALRQQHLVEELAREALAAQDFARVASALALLDDESRASDRWQYWAARTQDELNSTLPLFDEPTAIYKALAKNRSFYGFLSADKVKQEYSLADSSRPLEPMQLEAVAGLPDMRRAHELWLTGNLSEAKAEWIHLSRKLEPQQLLAAGQLARQWGWYNTGIQAMISGDLWDQLTVRFPLAYREQIFKFANDTQVEPTFIYAIARQESAFDDQARSPVGAMGLMQIMPKTALYTAKKSGIQHSRPTQLLDPEHNMLLGAHYLNHLLSEFNGNRILAAAAYNAGPSRVNRWLSPAGQERPADIWIETIPFKETRYYVQNVLCFSVIYGYRLGQPTAFLSEAEAKSFL